jgi:hypothetical protein
MNALPKLVAHSEWANKVWRGFIAESAPSDDWLRQRISHIMLGERADLLTRDLTQMIAFQRFTGEKYESPIADILLHLILHGSHHRGQMATHASAAGLRAINTDYVEYCRIHRL